MSAYIVATILIGDSAKFQSYVKAIAGLSEQYGGEYVLRGAVLEGFEGPVVPGERVVILKFPDVQSARDFYNSPAYQEGKALRLGAAEVTMRLIDA